MQATEGRVRDARWHCDSTEGWWSLHATWHRCGSQSFQTGAVHADMTFFSLVAGRSGYDFEKNVFCPSSLRPKGHFRCLSSSVCLSVPMYDQSSPRDNSGIFFKLRWNILWLNISDRFDHEYRSSLDISVIDQKVILTFLKVMKSFCSYNLEIWDP